MVSEVSEDKIKEWLYEVKDPEIPVISVVDLGVIKEVEIAPEGHITVEMVPTFAGCPAINFMKMEIEEVLKNHGLENVEVKVNYNRKWSSNDVTELGRKQMLEYGLSPPPRFEGEVEMEHLEKAICPNCGSTETVMNSTFGPTLCRALHKCNNCGEAFEQFKPL